MIQFFREIISACIQRLQISYTCNYWQSLFLRRCQLISHVYANNSLHRIVSCNFIVAQHGQLAIIIAFLAFGYNHSLFLIAFDNFFYPFCQSRARSTTLIVSWCENIFTPRQYQLVNLNFSLLSRKVHSSKDTFHW